MHVGIVITGRVQGVGFRPFVYRLAMRHGIVGHVENNSLGVCIDAGGQDESVTAFVKALEVEKPPLAEITGVRVTPLTTPPEADSFTIRLSSRQSQAEVLVSPDVATCADCLNELFTPGDRRYLYPFINCTNCGPRFTLTRSIPYDRAGTSMACFPLCHDCATEYANPADRRFHAQPDACPVCGPRIWLADAAGDTRPPSTPSADFIEPVRAAAAALLDGDIVAIKGIGGFHLACDAWNAKAIQELRRRKHRPHKALAVMCANLDAVRRIADVTPAEETVLAGRERPIVLVRRRSEKEGGLPHFLAPDTDTLGVMLPYAPLQHVLLYQMREMAMAEARPQTPSSCLPVLVMTSGNASGSPICLGNREALAALNGIADRFLFHDRDILVRADDSVVQVLDDGSTQFIRRARGYVPAPLPLLPSSSPGGSLAAFGADLKNTVTLTRGCDAFTSQYIGDLGNPGTNAFACEAREHLNRLLCLTTCEAAVCDLHPDYHSTRLAEEYAAGHHVPLFHLQHHAAHLYAVLAEHGHEGRTIGLILDGTGLGTDGSVWGGEVLLTEGKNTWRRLGGLSSFVLPGGDKAVREPWRTACALTVLNDLPLPHFPGVSDALVRAVAETVRAGSGIATTSCGRLFDAASALLGLCSVITYEGQAAIRLESAQDMTAPSPDGWIRFIEKSDGLVQMDAAHLFACVACGMENGTPVPVLARQFHAALSEGLVALLNRVAPQGVDTVALAGGVWLNRTMNSLVASGLARRGFTVLKPLRLPPGDAAISYGQAAWLARQRGVKPAGV